MGIDADFNTGCEANDKIDVFDLGFASCYPSIMARSIVFLSCGQRTQEELELGRQISDLISDCGFEPFYAQRRSDLRSLSDVIFESLSASAAYIAVVHRRELVDVALDNYRGSLFIEQELAVAAYIRRSRELPVLFYVQRGVERSGVRSTLLLNASFSDKEVFENDSEVIEHLRLELPKLRVTPTASVGYKLALEVYSACSTDGSKLTVSVYVRNLGTVLPRRAQLRVWIPIEFDLPSNLPGREGRDKTGDFEMIDREVSEPDLSLDSERPTLLFDFQIPRVRGFAMKELKFRLAADGQSPQEIVRSYQDLWKEADGHPHGV